MIVRLGLLLITMALMVPAHAGIIANSVDDFSDIQGQDNWFYGLFDAGGVAGSPAPYTVDKFQELDIFDATDSEWEASDALVGADNNDFLALNEAGGHPTGIGPGAQDSVIWAIRRYESDVAGEFQIDFDVRKLNVDNDRGGGITGRIFIDGVEQFTALIGNADGAGIQKSLVVDLAIGTVVDFAIDPTGAQPTNGGDGPFSARADGSHFSAVVRTVPLPAPHTATLVLLGLVGCTALRKRSRVG